MCKVEVRGSRGARVFAEEHDDADTQITSLISSHSNNVERHGQDPSEEEEFTSHGTFIDKHVDELVGANHDDEESDHLLGDSSDSEF